MYKKIIIETCESNNTILQMTENKRNIFTEHKGGGDAKRWGDGGEGYIKYIKAKVSPRQKENG